MFIYRIEDENGQGCYQNGVWEYNELGEHNLNSEKYPLPQDDKGIDRYIEEIEITGFKDLRQLKNWFSLKEVKRLRRNGFTIKKVEVDTITALGNKQVLAIRFPALYEIQKEPTWLKEHIGVLQ